MVLDRSRRSTGVNPLADLTIKSLRGTRPPLASATRARGGIEASRALEVDCRAGGGPPGTCGSARPRSESGACMCWRLAPPFHPLLCLDLGPRCLDCVAARCSAHLSVTIHARCAPYTHSASSPCRGFGWYVSIATAATLPPLRQQQPSLPDACAPWAVCLLQQVERYRLLQGLGYPGRHPWLRTRGQGSSFALYPSARLGSAFRVLWFAPCP